MNKQSHVIGSIWTKVPGALACAVLMISFLVLLGCPTDAGGGRSDPKKPEDLFGTMSAHDFNLKLKQGGSYTIRSTGLVILNSGTFFVPSNVKITFTGNLTLENKSAIIFENAASILGGGKLVSANATLVGDKAVTEKLGKEANITSVPFGSGKIDISGTNIAVKGDVAINNADTTSNSIKASDLSGKTLYIVGKLTVSEAVSATAINVGGNASVGVVITAPLVVFGNLTYTAPLTNTNEVIVGGTLDSGTNAITANSAIDAGELKGTSLTSSAVVKAGKVTLTSFTTGTVTANALTVAGPASIVTVTGGTAAAVFTFNGTTDIDTFTAGAPSTVIDGTGNVVIKKALGSTAINTVIIKNTTGVTLEAENTLAVNLKATNATIVGDSTGVTIKADGSDITVPAGGSIIASAQSGSQIVAGTSPDIVTFTKAVLGPGTYTATATGLTLGASTVLTLNESGTAVIAGAGKLTFGATADTTKLVLKPKAKLSVLNATGDLASTGAHINIGLLVAASKAPTAGTKKAVSASGTDWTVSSAAAMTPGTLILGKIQFAITSDNTDAVAGSDSNAAATGSLTAGTGTVLTLAGKA